jgi:hypothetical protein
VGDAAALGAAVALGAAEALSDGALGLADELPPEQATREHIIRHASTIAKIFFILYLHLFYSSELCVF